MKKIDYEEKIRKTKAQIAKLVADIKKLRAEVKALEKECRDENGVRA